MERGHVQGLPKVLKYPLLSQERVKSTDFKFSRYIYRIHLNKSQLKILQKREHGHIQGLPKFLGSPIISAMGKAMNFKFCTQIHGFNWNKSP